MGKEQLLGTNKTVTTVIKKGMFEKLGPNEKWIRRNTRYGNPFKIGEPHPDTGLLMNRDDVCNLFEQRVLPTLDVEELRGKNLCCFCAPQRCHGHSIVKKLAHT